LNQECKELTVTFIFYHTPSLYGLFMAENR
jgi:hypothetical protein